MNPMIMQLKITLAQKQKEYNEYKLKASRLIFEIQSNINPYFGDDLELLKAKEIEQIGDEMLIVKSKMLEIQDDIKRLKNELGE